MANSATDARGSELEIRKKLIESGAVDVIVSVGPNFFYTVTLPCTLWFLDKGKAKGSRGDEVLFIDARRVFRQIDRAHRDFTPSQIEFLANIVRLWRGTKTFTDKSSSTDVKAHFPGGKYRDVPGLCRRASQKEIEAQGWSLNPGRYVGVAPGVAVDETDFPGAAGGIAGRNGKAQWRGCCLAGAHCGERRGDFGRRMSIWTEIPLGELIELQRGYDLTEGERRDGPVPVCGSAGIHGYHNAARAPGPGVTVGRSGASIGVVTFIKTPIGHTIPLCS